MASGHDRTDSKAEAGVSLLELNDTHNSSDDFAEDQEGLLRGGMKRPNGICEIRSETLGSVCRVLIRLLPRFLRPYAYTSTQDVTPTSYLVALRGYAACVVVACHMDGLARFPILHFPMFRFATAGVSMVDVFFVISGYVLSYRMLQHMRKQDSRRFVSTLAGASFRRWLRLFLPTGMASLLCVFFMWFGAFEGSPTAFASTFIGQIWDWFCDFVWSSNPFHELHPYWVPGVYRTHYLDQMWTIPIEFRGSMIVFMYCAGCAMLTPRARITICFASTFMSFLWESVYAGLFIAGIGFAELSLIRQEQARENFAMHAIKRDDGEAILPTEKESTTRTIDSLRAMPISVSKRIGCVVCVLTAIFLFGQPDGTLDAGSIFPWNYLRYGIPTWWEGGREHFWYGIGALILIYGLDNYPTLHVPLLWPCSQYLGEISFGMYAVHNLIVWSLDIRVLRPWQYASLGGPGWGFLIAAAPLVFVVFWLADYFARVDAKLVNFGHRLQQRYFVRWTGALK